MEEELVGSGRLKFEIRVHENVYVRSMPVGGGVEDVVVVMDGPSSHASKKTAPGVAKNTNGTKPLQPGQKGAVEMGKEGAPASPAWVNQNDQRGLGPSTSKKLATLRERVGVRGASFLIFVVSFTLMPYCSVLARVQHKLRQLTRQYVYILYIYIICLYILYMHYMHI